MYFDLLCRVRDLFILSTLEWYTVDFTENVMDRLAHANAVDSRPGPSPACFRAWDRDEATHTYSVCICTHVHVPIT